MGRPVRGAGECGEGRWLAAPPRGRTFFRWHGGAGEARQLQNPLSSSGQTALYSGRPAGEGIPHTAPLPLLFPTKPASLGFCGVPLSEEKENAPFDGVREKGLGGGIPGLARNALFRPVYGGFGLVVAGGLDSCVSP